MEKFKTLVGQWHLTVTSIQKRQNFLRSHKDNNFIEPLKYYVPSIGISEIVKIKENINTKNENLLLVFKFKSKFNLFYKS